MNEDEFKNISGLFDGKLDTKEEKLDDEDKQLIINNILDKYPDITTLEILEKLVDSE